jgi:hypothetical protein
MRAGLTPTLMTRWTSLLAAAGSLATAPLLLAPPGGGCTTCDQAFQLMLNNEVGWQELDVIAGERHQLLIVALEGQVSAELVTFDRAARIHDLRCERDGEQTLCEFVAGADGQLGVALEPRGESAEVLLELTIRP